MEGFEARLGGRILRIDGGELESDMVEYLMAQAVQELEKLDAQEIKASTDLRTGTFSLTIAFETKDLLVAQEVASTKVRSAFHVAGVGTPDWMIDWVEACVVPEGQLAAV